MSERTQAEALVVVDLQRGLVEGPGAIPRAQDVCEAIATLLAAARSSGAPVVHLQNDGALGACDEPGSAGWTLCLPPQPGEPVLRKTQDDPFVETDLAQVMRDASVERAVVCGVLAEMCVAATARGLLQRGVQVVMPRDARGTYDIPRQGPTAPRVPHELVARTAEWSLGDEVVLVDRASHVVFRRSRPMA